MITALRHFREVADISQTSLAERSGISQPSISNYERGLEIPQDHARRLLEILKASGRIPSAVGPEDLSLEWTVA